MENVVIGGDSLTDWMKDGCKYSNCALLIGFAQKAVDTQWDAIPSSVRTDIASRLATLTSGSGGGPVSKCNVEKAKVMSDFNQLKCIVFTKKESATRIRWIMANNDAISRVVARCYKSMRSKMAIRIFSNWLVYDSPVVAPPFLSRDHMSNYERETRKVISKLQDAGVACDMSSRNRVYNKYMRTGDHKCVYDGRSTCQICLG